MDPRAVASSRAPNHTALHRTLPALLLCSGATGLVYEVVMARYIAVYLGSSGASQAITLAVFLGGMSAGALLAQRLIRRILERDTAAGNAAQLAVMGYAAIEAFIGVWAALWPTLSSAGFSGYYALTGGWEAGSAATMGMKLLVAGGLVAPLTFAMGATLPILATAAHRTTAGQGVALVSRFYSVNAAGGAAGTLLAGFYLIERLGLDEALYLCALLNLVIAWLSARVAKGMSGAVKAEPSSQEESASGSKGSMRVLVFVAGVTGFVTLMSEVVWTRLYSLLLGASVYAFPLMLFVVIAGISTGSALAARAIQRGARPRLLFAGCQLAAALCTLFLLIRLETLPADLFRLRGLLAPRAESYGFWLLGSGTLVGLHLLPVALALGAAFPALLAAGRAAGVGTDRATGWILGVNTLGNLLGALLTGFWVLPWLGLRGTLMAATVLAVANALLILRPWTWRRLIGPVVCTVALVGVYQQPQGLTLLYRGLFRDAPAMTAQDIDRQLEGRRTASEQIFLADGKDASITVDRYEDGTLTMRTNGKTDASDTDASTQYSLGYLGFLFHPNIENALVIGLGSGQTAAAVASFPNVRLTVAEISSEVVEAADYFKPSNADVLSNERVSLQISDAREVLRHTPERSLDLLVSEPSNPWVVGVADLFTTEHFELSASRLKDEGVLVQWIQTYELTDSILREILCTLHATFPSVRLFRVSPGDLVAVGQRTAQAPDPAVAAASFARSQHGALSHSAAYRPADIDIHLAMQIAGPGPVDDLCDGFDEALSIRYPSIEYRAPREVFSRQEVGRLLAALDSRTRPEMEPDTLLARHLRGNPLTPERRMRLYQFFGARGIEEERWLHLATAPEGGRPPEERVLEMGLPALDSVPVGYAQNLCPWLRRARPRLPAGVETVFGVAKSSAGVSAWLQLCGISGR